MKQEHDAEGNVTAVDGGTTATYTYDALNHRVRTVVGTTATEYVFNAAGQRVSEWNGSNYAQLKGHYYWGSKPVAYYTTANAGAAATHFEHQDWPGSPATGLRRWGGWMGTERVRTTYNGAVEGTYTSLPYGDNSAASGTDTDANHYAMLDHDSESGTDHAQFRQYGNTQGRFMSPDPYDGSYDASNPQSFNRYAYALNSPLSYVDPSGLCSTQEYDEGGNPITCIEAWTWRTYMNSIDLDGSMTCSMSQVDCQSYFIMLLLQTSNASLPVSSRPSGGGGGGGGSAAPNNALTYVSKRASCAGQALMQNKLQTGLDALGLIPGEATIIKSGQIAGAVVAGGYSAYQQNMAGTGLSGVGLVMSVLNAEKASIGKNLAEAIPFLGQGVSAVAVGYDIFGSKEYKSCMSGAN